ncbi:MAG TPA: anti-sigma factor [Geminicoccaceae bacterium]|mgnify:CR=1 FL=1|nr:anti-sigma factor [Geminicoccus sp.]HMU51881.1 anti-sigma factor [Geminicoccaceae bacterium]
MTARDDDLQALAGEYVLGMLAGEERDRVERRMTGDPRLRSCIEAWQQRLQPLVDAVEPIEPSPAAWQRIETTLGSPAALRQRRPLAAEQHGPGWWGRIGFWRGWATVATLAALGLAGWILSSRPLMRQPQAQAPRLLAVLSSVGGEPFWLVGARPTGSLDVRPVQEIARTAQAHELWLLPPGEKPVSLGILETAAGSERALPPALASRIGPGAALAITLEPAGGAAGGVPTGPVTYRGRLIEVLP